MKTLNTMLQAARLYLVAAVILAGCGLSYGQTALTQTTLSTAVTTTSQTTLQVASATGINAPQPFQTSGMAGVSTQLYIDDEMLAVERVQGTLLTVQRGINGTRARTHASGANVFIVQMQTQTQAAIAYSLGGSCTPGVGLAAFSPVIDYYDAQTYQCETLNGQNEWVVQTIQGQQHFPNLLSLGTAAYTNATTTYSTVTNLSFPVVSNHTYSMTCNLVWQGSVTTAGPKLQVTGPSSPTAVLLAADGGTGAAAYADAAVTAFSSGITAFGTAGAGATNYVMHVNLTVINGANAGTVALQAAANGSGTLTVQPGSYCVQF